MSQSDDLRQTSLSPWTPSSARWPKAELEPSAWEHCAPPWEGMVSGVGEGQAALWMGWQCASLLTESDSDPLLAPACSGSASCSFGSWRLGWLFTSPLGLRPGRRGAGVCVPTPSPSPRTGVGEKEVQVGVLGSGYTSCNTFPVLSQACFAWAQRGTRHAGQMTR